MSDPRDAPELRDAILESLQHPSMQGQPREIWAAALAMQLIREGWTKVHDAPKQRYCPDEKCGGDLIRMLDNEWMCDDCRCIFEFDEESA